jgi:hypothetical protein
MLWDSMSSSVKYFIALLAISLSLSCGPKPPGLGASRGKELPAPYALRAEADSHRATLQWSINRSRNDYISGYNIYLADDLAVKDRSAWIKKPGVPYNQAPYPGDTDGDISRESISLKNLDNGRSYLALVRTVGPDGGESESSNIAAFTPVASGIFIISANQDASNGGFNFESETQVPGRGPKSDIYLYTTEKRIGLSAPYRLGGGFRKTKFTSSTTSTPVETISIRKGQSIEVRTKTGQADIRIEDIMGRYPDVTVKISYVFHPNQAQ